MIAGREDIKHSLVAVERAWPARFCSSRNRIIMIVSLLGAQKLRSSHAQFTFTPSRREEARLSRGALQCSEYWRDPLLQMTLFQKVCTVRRSSIGEQSRKATYWGSGALPLPYILLMLHNPKASRRRLHLKYGLTSMVCYMVCIFGYKLHLCTLQCKLQGHFDFSRFSMHVLPPWRVPRTKEQLPSSPLAHKSLHNHMAKIWRLGILHYMVYAIDCGTTTERQDLRSYAEVFKASVEFMTYQVGSGT